MILRSFMKFLMNIGITIFACILSAGALLLSGCERKPEAVSRTGFYFDTAVSITLYGQENADELLTECMALCTRYERLLSRTVKGSDIWRINHSEGKPTEVDQETAALIRLALSYSELSDGAFDCTIAPVSELWDFHGDNPHKPETGALEKALKYVDHHNVKVTDNTVTLGNEHMALDLGGIAKGYIADRLKDFLIGSGAEHALINLGGNVLAIKNKPDGSAFRIGVRKPFGPDGESIATVALSDRSLVTSGVYERYFEEDGARYHHLLNPRTGMPFDNGLLSVTILCGSSAEADALSTACFGLGLENGMALIEELEDTEALFITDDYELHGSSGFPSDNP